MVRKLSLGGGANEEIPSHGSPVAKGRTEPQTSVLLNCGLLSVQSALQEQTAAACPKLPDQHRSTSSALVRTIEAPALARRFDQKSPWMIRFKAHIHFAYKRNPASHFNL